MGKKRKTETGKVATAASTEPLRNGKAGSERPGSETQPDKQSPPASKRKKTGKNSALCVDESGKVNVRLEQIVRY